MGGRKMKKSIRLLVASLSAALLFSSTIVVPMDQSVATAWGIDNVKVTNGGRNIYLSNFSNSSIRCDCDDCDEHDDCDDCDDRDDCDVSKNKGGNSVYSTSWSAKIKAPATGNYTFYLDSNHGASFYVGDMNTPVIVGTYSSSSTSKAASVSFAKDSVYLIRLESFNARKHTQNKLEWSGPSFSRTKLAKNDFYCESNSNSTDTEKPSVPTNLTVTTSCGIYGL
jgi:PA14 domain